MVQHVERFKDAMALAAQETNVGVAVKDLLLRIANEVQNINSMQDARALVEDLRASAASFSSAVVDGTPASPTAPEAAFGAAPQHSNSREVERLRDENTRLRAELEDARTFSGDTVIDQQADGAFEGDPARDLGAHDGTAHRPTPRDAMNQPEASGITPAPDSAPADKSKDQHHGKGRK